MLNIRTAGDVLSSVARTPHQLAALLITAACNVGTLRTAARIPLRTISESFIPFVSRAVRPALASESSLRTALIPVLRKALLAGAAAGNVKLRARGYKPTFDPSSVDAWLAEHVALSAKSIAATTSQLADPATDERIALIAQTEAHTAVCQGQRMAWRALRTLGDVEGRTLAKRRGFIEPRRMWLTMTGACEACEELDGRTARMEGQYPGEGGDGPPLHINCMCEENLVDNPEE